MSKDEINGCYVYRHVRLDNNKVFYIGIGSTKRFKRAYWKYDRNMYWRNTVNLTEYKVEVLFENLTWNEACELEISLIWLYGRKDLGLGTLVNLTNGGDGNYGRIVTKEMRNLQSIRVCGKNHHFYGKTLSEEHRNAIRKTLIGTGKGSENSFYGKTHSDESKLKMSNTHKGKKLSIDNIKDIKVRMKKGVHPRAKLVLDTETGIFYDCARDAADSKNLKYPTLNGFLKGNYKNKTSFIYV